METLLGLYMIYSLIHFAIIQHKKVWEDRTTYEKIVTWVAIFTVASIVYSL